MLEENKAIVRRLYQEGINHGNLAVIDEIYAPEAELHLPGVPEDPFGPGPVRQWTETLHATFPGIAATIEDLIAEGDRAVARVTLRRPHDGRALGVAPQSRLVVWTRIDVFRLFRGRIVEHWADRDDLGVLAQLGVTPSALDAKGRFPSSGYA